MIKNANQQLEYKQKQFEEFIRKGLQASSKRILKVSADCAKHIKNSPVEALATNVDQTINTFIKDQSDGLLRFNMMSEPLVQLVVSERGKLITKIDSIKKIEQHGKAFGFMIGISVLTSVIKIFLLQAGDNLKNNEEMSEDAKRVCIEYINDVFTIVLKILSDELDTNYKVAKRERVFFAELLRNNDWKTIFDRLDTKKPSTDDNVSASQP